MTVYDEHEGWAWGQLAERRLCRLSAGRGAGDPRAGADARVAALRSFVFPGPNLKLPPTGFLSLGAAVSVIGR